MKKIELRVNGFDERCVIDSTEPDISILKNETIKTEYCSLYITDTDGATIWESGNCEFAPYFRCTGAELQPKTEYTVTAELLQDGLPVYGASAEFATGFLGTDWLAEWIEPEQEPAVKENEIPFYELFIPKPEFFGGHTRLRPCLEIQKNFFLKSDIETARLYATAHGIYRVRLNGSGLENNLFSPETSPYNDRLYYQSFDISDLCVEGENELLFTLADGWWAGRIGISGDSCQYGDRLGLLAQLEITLKNGNTVCIGSDSSFESRRSIIDYADLFIGQRTDFSAEPGPWSPCLKADYPKDNLTAQPTRPIHIYNEYNPEFFVSPAGELIADFGQVIAGITDITVSAPEGTEVTLDYCEVLDRDGNFLRNILGRNKDQRDVCICCSGETRFRPDFTYHGFRFVRISGVSKEQIISIKALAMGTELEQRGYFSCSDRRLNRLQHNIQQSTRANMFSVPTDCPQREKAGWTGDILDFAPTGCFNYSLESFLSSWLSNMRLEQFESGEIPVVVPNYPVQEKNQKAMGGSSSSAWSDACILVPLEIYRSYGNISILTDNFEMMKGWINWVTLKCLEKPEDLSDRTAAEKKWNEFLFNTGFHFGDWFIPSFVQKEGGVFAASEATKDVVASCYHAITLEAWSVILQTLISAGQESSGLNAELEKTSERLSLVKKAVEETYISSEGIVKGDLQGLYVMALQAGIGTPGLQNRMAERLVCLIEENGGRLDTGFVSTPHLLDILYKHGHKKTAFGLLFQTESPSWLYMVEHGATTIWENWEAVRPDGSVMPSSFNHYALGSVGSFLYTVIGGIKIAAHGYKSIEFSPATDCGLKFADCSIRTAWGKASCSWKQDGESCRISIIVPAGVDAVYSADGIKRKLRAGLNEFTI